MKSLWKSKNEVVQLIFEPRDLWMGVYYTLWQPAPAGQYYFCDIFICLVPCRPIKIHIEAKP